MSRRMFVTLAVLAVLANCAVVAVNAWQGTWWFLPAPVSAFASIGYSLKIVATTPWWDGQSVTSPWLESPPSSPSSGGPSDGPLVEFLRGWQADRRVHPFTCNGGNPEEHVHDHEVKLTPTRDGWVCPECGRVQFYAGFEFEAYMRHKFSQQLSDP